MDSLPTKRRRINYSTRLFLWLLGYSLLLVGSFVAFQYHREKSFRSSEVNSQLQLINGFILSQLADGVPVDSIAATGFAPFDHLRISVLDSRGYLLFDNYTDSMPNRSHANRLEVRRAMTQGSGYAVHRHSESTGETYFYSATRSPRGIIVRTAAPYNLTLNSLLRADYGFLWIMGIITVLMCALGYFATRRLGQHILRLNRFARRAESGVSVSDIEPFPSDELGEISNNIVRLYADLQHALADRDREHRAAIFQQQEKERIKKQLTNNINHELKTPVASIRLCLETIAAHPELPPYRREEFIRRSLTHCDRLSRLLSDVSLITRMTDGDKAVIKEPVSLTDIIAEAVAEKSELAAHNGITIRNLFTHPATLLGNATLLLSVFHNLLDNAISYSSGSTITIAPVDIAGDHITLTFTDNGTGVPQEHLPHLFERFYRIDKGRSRAAGGTGLGLSIVRNAVAIHSGTITVANRRPSGLAFTIRFAVDT